MSEPGLNSDPVEDAPSAGEPAAARDAPSVKLLDDPGAGATDGGTPAVPAPLHFVVRIRRYNPESDAAPHWEDYHVDAQPTDRVLDALRHRLLQPDLV